MVRLMRNRLTWDLNFEGGYGHIFSSPTRGGGFLRPGAGATLVAAMDALIDRLRHYFLTYKDMPQGSAVPTSPGAERAPRRVEITDIYDAQEAEQVTRLALADYEAEICTPASTG